jgi:hypothetical protein
LRKSFRFVPVALFLIGASAHAEPHGGFAPPHGGFAAPHAPVERHEGMERHEFHEPYRTPHWTFDDRFHHDHFYPAPGYAIGAMPDGHIGVNFGGSRFFYQAGVWYQPSGTGYVVVQPPAGIVAPMLPPAYTTVYVAGLPYYYANGIYYVATEQGYAVAQPPADPTVLAPQPVTLVPPPPGTWSYCGSAKSYYPYVSECPEGWRTVPAIPPNTTQP